MKGKVWLLHLTENGLAANITSESLEEMAEALRHLASSIERGYTQGPVTADRIDGTRRNPRICSFTVVHEDAETYKRLKEATR